MPRPPRAAAQTAHVPPDRASLLDLPGVQPGGGGARRRCVHAEIPSARWVGRPATGVGRPATADIAIEIRGIGGRSATYPGSCPLSPVGSRSVATGNGHLLQPGPTSEAAPGWPQEPAAGPFGVGPGYLMPRERAARPGTLFRGMTATIDPDRPTSQRIRRVLVCPRRRVVGRRPPRQSYMPWFGVDGFRVVLQYPRPPRWSRVS